MKREKTEEEEGEEEGEGRAGGGRGRLCNANRVPGVTLGTVSEL